MSSTSRKRGGHVAPPPSYLDRPYTPGDVIPTPEVIDEGSSETDWALWSEVNAQTEQRFAPTMPASMPMGLNTVDRAWAPTAPAGLPGANRQGAARAPEPGLAVDLAMQVARRNNRVCPRPGPWQALYETLVTKRPDVRGPMPPAPATGGAWAVTPPLAKRLCFREQIEWAHRNGLLEVLMAYIQALPEDQWLHMGEE